MSLRISIFEVTDSHLASAAAARLAKAPAHDTPRDRMWLREIAAHEAIEKRRRIAQAKVAMKAAERRLAEMHRCSRCGIDTTEPDLCIDCFDVLVMEVR